MRIRTIEAFPLTYPVEGRFKFFEGPDGSQSGRPSVVVKIVAEDDTIGWGQSVPVPRWSYETLESVTSSIRDYFAPVLTGHPVFDLEGAHRIMDGCIAGSFSTGMPIAKAGVDLALHDLLGRQKNQNLISLWGKSGADRITLSWTLNPRNLAEVDDLIEQGLRSGYRHFNVKVAPDLAFDLALCQMVRERVPEGFLWADANGGYDLATALKAAAALADLGVDVLEQPLKPNQLTGYQRLKRQGALPIILDEGVVSTTDLIEFIRLDMLDGVAMKPARCGGLFSARRQMEILQDAGLLMLGSGLTDPDLSLAASLLLFGAFDYRLPAALNGPQFLARSILRKPLKPAEGFLDVPQGPGLGVDIDEALLAEYSTPALPG
jgi:L-alanine-DL-glutamate epimerase-like enolase superfamily enzyme